MTNEDAELLRALQEEHGDALYAHVLRLTGGDRQRAEDLVQETLLRAWRQPDAMEPHRGAVRAWLFSTANELARESVGRPPVRTGERVDEPLPDVPEAQETDRAVEAWTTAEAMSRLAPIHRQIIVECFYQGRSVGEAATRLGVPPATVKSRMHYAVRSLRLILAELGVTQ